MARFRKKPVEIEAVQYKFGMACPNWLHTAIEAGTVRMMGSGDSMALLIETLEGAMTARAGDWIIQGVKGELYPCKPEIFAATYDRVESPS